MADTDANVMNAVEAELKRNPDASVDDLFEMAKGINKSVGKLTKRQFHARYPLQVKRRAGGTRGPGRSRASTGRKSGGRRKSSASGSEAGRDGVRKTMLEFASELASAESRKDAVRVVSEIDKYVDQILRVIAKG